MTGCWAVDDATPCAVEVVVIVVVFAKIPVAEVVAATRTAPITIPVAKIATALDLARAILNVSTRRGLLLIASVKFRRS